MSDPAGIAVRFLVYLALSLAFGTSAMALLDRRQVSRCLTAALVVAGLAASASSLVMLCAAMGGVPLLPVDRALMTLILTETPVGAAFVIRFLALGGALAALVLSRGRTVAVSLCSGIALGSLAWAGHGAVHEGAARMMHLTSTIVHLLAAGLWIGGIATLLAGLTRRDGVAALHRFSSIGTAVVAVLAVTGLANLLFVVGTDGLAGLPVSTYGRLLFLKLAGFVGMLALASVHRWYFVPRLPGAGAGAGAGDDACDAVRISLGAELMFGMLVLATVAWLGMLSPGS